jgi:hypothetical protein
MRMTCLGARPGLWRTCGDGRIAAVADLARDLAFQTSRCLPAALAVAANIEAAEA